MTEIPAQGRDHGAHSPEPVITCSTRREDRAKSEECGAEDFFPKSLSVAYVQKTVTALPRRSSEPSSASGSLAPGPC